MSTRTRRYESSDRYAWDVEAPVVKVGDEADYLASRVVPVKVVALEERGLSDDTVVVLALVKVIESREGYPAGDEFLAATSDLRFASRGT